MQIQQNAEKKEGTFHTQANLSQALIAIIRKHYESLNAGQPIPPFVLEALSLMCHNIAAVVDSNVYSLKNWNNLSDLPKEVISIIEQAIPQAPEERQDD